MLIAAAVVAAALIAGACDGSAAGPQLVEHGKPPKDANGVARDVGGSLNKTPAPISSSSDAAVRTEVNLDGEPWTVTHAANPAGTFSLVRNTSEPARDGRLLVSITGRDDSVLAPRATTVLSCDLIDDGARVSVRTELGAAIYSAPIKCGDALYVRSVAPE